MTAPSQTLPELSTADLRQPDRVLVSLDNKVYDVSEFADMHPGGPDLVREYRGHNMADILRDPALHAHSDTAFELLRECPLVGVLSGTTPAQSRTNYSDDYAHSGFLDLGRPLLTQLLFSSFSKEFYLEQVHKPRHYGPGSAPLFGNFLEPISKTPWYVVPLLWVPVDLFFVSRARHGLSALALSALYVLGLAIWTLVEYLLHRFLFHLDRYLPDHRVAFTVHFLLHGVHHFLPMDSLRLVMPPALLVALTTPLYHLAHLIFPYYAALAVFAGSFMGYILYDCTHYFLHHRRLPSALNPLKKHHLDHHYKDYDVGFGVTLWFWDRVFGSV